MDTRKMLSLLAATALMAIPGCSTDNAVEKDAKDAAPTVEKAADDVGTAAEDAADAVDDNDSK